MLFERVSILNEVLKIFRHDARNTPKYSSDLSFHDTKNPEIDKLYNSSPLVQEQRDIFDVDSPLDADYECLSPSSDPTLSKKETGTKNGRRVAKNVIKSELVFSTPEAFTCPPKIQRPSLLTATIQGTGTNSIPGRQSPVARGSSVPEVVAGGINITVYMPGGKSQLTVRIGEGWTVEEVLRRALSQHRADRLEPVLHNDAPENYELRLHEGDGEPDLDFPPLDRAKQLLSYGKLSEVCLRLSTAAALMSGKAAPPPSVVEQVNAAQTSDPLGKAAPGPASDAPPPAVTPAVPSNRRSMSNLPSAGGGSQGTHVRQRTGSVGLLAGQLPMNTVTILLPNAGHMKLRVNEKTLVKDLLPQIANKHRLRLFTDEYCFVMSRAEQLRLNPVTTAVDLGAPLLTLGIRELELQKRIFADSVKASRAGRTARGGGGHDWRGATNNTEFMPPPAYGYLDATSSVYQEWPVVAKHGLGQRREHHVMGIDSLRVYIFNHPGLQPPLLPREKGDVFSDRSPGLRVQKHCQSQRYVSYVSQVTFTDGDPSSFRISWSDLKKPYETEYRCETARDCIEIVAKLKHLLSLHTK